MAAREYLQIVTESAYGVPKASPVLGTDYLVIRLDEGNAFTMRPKPKQVVVNYGGGFATGAIMVAAETEVKGSLKTKMCYSQASLLMGWMAARINAGQTSPWTTTEIAGDLASMSVYHAIQRSDGTYKKKWYPGVKVDKWKADTSREAQVVTLSLDLIAQKVNGNTYDASSDPTTLFPVPAETDYPLDLMLFQHTSGNLKIANAGTARVGYDSLSIEVDNKLDGKSYESRWLQLLRFLGRESKLMAKLLLKTTPDDRAAYEAITTQATSVKFDNGTHSLIVDFKGQNYLTGVDDELPLDKLYEQGLQLVNLFDQSAATDVGYTYA